MSLQKKVSLIVGLIVIVTFAGIATFVVGNMLNLIEEKEQEEYLLLSEAVQARLSQQIEATEVSVLSIAQNREVQRLFSERNREGLADMLLPSYLAVEDRVAQMQFHLPDSTSFLRLHMPDRYGDSLREFRHTVNEANASQSLVSGLERGVGGYGIRVVAPVRYQGEHVGSFEFGSDFGDDFLEGIKTDFGGEYLLYTLNDGDESNFDITTSVDEKTMPLAATVTEDQWPIAQEYLTNVMNGKVVYTVCEGRTNGVILIPFTDYTGAVDGYFKVVVDRSNIIASINNLRNVMIGFLILAAMVITFAINFFMRKAIIVPVKKIEKVLSDVAAMDLTPRVDYQSKDEIGKIAQDLNKSLDVLEERIIKVGSAATNVAGATDQIAAGNQDLSQRTEEQASSLEGVTAAFEDITNSVKNSTYRASGVAENADNTLKNIKKGEQVTENMGEAMAEITASNDAIAEITEKVNEIAFQTNLLALNAAVEAARAGEQGKSFAVVAAEVRSLSNRSAEAAKEIERLIETSTAKVNKGNELMIDTKKVFKEIIVNNEKVSTAIQEVALGLQDQSTSIEDVRGAIDELNEVTQQNAALVEEIASSSQHMNSEAVELDSVSKEFKTSASK
ncbi:methyl-accepting chemotaxis protein [Desulfitispora alkaliphila]|uniref:methyl-accepting chemotaxis protein n=1 Tax=Desulfitispora alkaliphila TaxID=622674 RepID=UPI003D26240D